MFPGAFAKFDIGDRVFVGRISSVFKSDRSWTVESDMYGGPSKKLRALNDVWLTVNAVVTTSDEVSYFGMKHIGSSGGFDDITKENAVLLGAEFAVPINMISASATVRVHRHERDPLLYEGENHSCCPDDQDHQHTGESQLGLDVWHMAVPETESKINRFAIFNKWVKIFDHHRRQEHAARSGMNRGLRKRMNLDAKKNEDLITRPLQIQIHILKLIPSDHIDKTPAEAELEAGEIDVSDITTVAVASSCQSEDGKVLTINVDFYIDKFGVFRTTHRSAGAMYLTFHNMNCKGRDQIRNHFVVGFSPNGAGVD